MAKPKPEFIPFDRHSFGKGEVNPDKTTSPTSLSIDIHYAKIGVQGAWDKKRVLRLCGWLRITRYELSSLIMLPHRQMDKYMEKGIFPGPVALLLSIFENHVAKGILMDAATPEEGEPLIPTHLTNGSTEET